jgi:hypothetical protein
VSDYTGLSFHEVRQLELIQYLTWRRDAFIWKMSQTEEGQKYLDNAWRLEQTRPDRAALREQFGKEGRTDGS